jgi:hypothetical protein
MLFSFVSLPFLWILVALRCDFTELFASVALGLESAYDSRVLINQPNVCGGATYIARLFAIREGA